VGAATSGGKRALLPASAVVGLAALAAGAAAGSASAPTAVDDTATVSEDAPFSGIDVTANDTDVDGGPKTVASVDATGTHGEVKRVPDRPNIVFIFSDDQSIESVAKMPFVSGSTRWHRFENAFINNPMCCPSRATTLTGKYSHHTQVENNTENKNFDDSSTITTWLDGVGYRTGFFGKYHLGSIHGRFGAGYIPSGWDEWVSFRGGTGQYYDYELNENGQIVSYGSRPEDYSTDVLTGKAVDFVRESAGGPFFLFLAAKTPHDPYTPAPRHHGSFTGEPIPHSPNFNETDVSDKPRWWQGLSPLKLPDIDIARRGQYANLLALDEAVQSIVDVLRGRRLLNDTVIVYMTDNGFAFGEHRWKGKGCAYEECVRTPLLVAAPWTTPQTHPELVGNVDIAPTFAALAGTAPSTPVDGRSLAPLLVGSSAGGWRREVLLRFKDDPGQNTPPTFWGLRTARYKYVETVETGETELYDLSSDPFELRSVAERPEYAGVRDGLSERLAELKARPATTSADGSRPDLTYKPDRDYCNTDGSVPDDTFTYTLNGGSTATVSVKVTCVEDLPVAVRDSASVTEDDSAAQIDVLANDTDVDGGPMRIVSVDPSGANGEVRIADSGTTITYKPDRDYCNTDGSVPDDTFTYTLNGGSTATVPVRVTCVDDLPVAVRDSASVTEDDPAAQIDVLANDTDVDGGSNVVSVDPSRANGEVRIADSGTTLTYKPDRDYCNTDGSVPDDAFAYTLDGGSSATVSVRVMCVDLGLHVSARRTQRSTRVVRVRARCTNEACRAVARGRLRVPRGGKPARRFNLKPARKQLDAGEQEGLELRLKKRAGRATRNALRQGRTAWAKLRVKATDASGDSDVARLRVRLDRPLTSRTSVARRSARSAGSSSLSFPIASRVALLIRAVTIAAS
jgi:N-acetylglucosamine-6-sulfatase